MTSLPLQSAVSAATPPASVRRQATAVLPGQGSRLGFNAAGIVAPAFDLLAFLALAVAWRRIRRG